MHTVSDGADAGIGAAGVVTTLVAEDGLGIGAAGLPTTVTGTSKAAAYVGAYSAVDCNEATLVACSPKVLRGF